MQQCNTCKQTKSFDEFHINKRNTSGYSYSCKKCKNLYKRKLYSNYDEKHKEEARKQYTSCYIRNRDYVHNYLKTKECVDCGDKRWQVLEFDHVKGTKTHTICKMIRRRMSIANLQAEMDKCELRCANCHRIKTAIQLGWMKAEGLVTLHQNPDSETASAC